MSIETETRAGSGGAGGQQDSKNAPRHGPIAKSRACDLISRPDRARITKSFKVVFGNFNFMPANNDSKR
jgi:hypothetical protein